MKRDRIILFIGIFLLGLLIGKLINWPYFNISKEINVGDLLSVSASFILAYVVVQVLEKGNEDRRVEKGIVLNNLKDLGTNIDLLVSKMRTGQSNHLNTISHFKTFHLQLKKVFKQVDKIGHQITESEKQNIFSSLRRLKDLSSSTPRNSNTTEPEIEIISDEIFYSDKRVNEIQNEWDRLDDMFFSLQVQINRAS